VYYLKNKSVLIGKFAMEILKGELMIIFLGSMANRQRYARQHNVNEVIAYRGHVLKGGKLTDKKNFLHPNDDVNNKSQSSNDTFRPQCT